MFLLVRSKTRTLQPMRHNSSAAVRPPTPDPDIKTEMPFGGLRSISSADMLQRQDYEQVVKVCGGTERKRYEMAVRTRSCIPVQRRFARQRKVVGYLSVRRAAVETDYPDHSNARNVLSDRVRKICMAAQRSSVCARHSSTARTKDVGENRVQFCSYGECSLAPGIVRIPNDSAARMRIRSFRPNYRLTLCDLAQEPHPCFYAALHLHSRPAAAIHSRLGRRVRREER